MPLIRFPLNQPSDRSAPTMATVRPCLSWTGISQATSGLESVESKNGFDQ